MLCLVATRYVFFGLCRCLCIRDAFQCRRRLSVTTTRELITCPEHVSMHMTHNLALSARLRLTITGDNLLLLFEATGSWCPDLALISVLAILKDGNRRLREEGQQRPLSAEGKGLDRCGVDGCHIRDLDSCILALVGVICGADYAALEGVTCNVSRGSTIWFGMDCQPTRRRHWELQCAQASRKMPSRSTSALPCAAQQQQQAMLLVHKSQPSGTSR